MDEQHKPTKCCRTHASNMRSWVTFPVLDWFLYTPRLRAIISELKAKGDFRREGLRQLHKWQIWISVILFSYSSIFIIFDGITINTCVIIVVSAYALYSITSATINKIIIPYSMGGMTFGVVTHMEFHRIWLGVRDWLVWYQFDCSDGNIETGKVISIRREDMRPINPEIGRMVIIFYDPMHLKYNSMFAPGLFDRACISCARHAKRQEIIHFGVK